MTGIQALERKTPDLPMRPGKIERHEARVHSPRHPNRFPPGGDLQEESGGCALMASFDVVSGQVIHPTVEDTRTEVDYLAHVQQTIATDPNASKWHAYHGRLLHPSI